MRNIIYFSIALSLSIFCILIAAAAALEYVTMWPVGYTCCYLFKRDTSVSGLPASLINNDNRCGTLTAPLNSFDCVGNEVRTYYNKEYLLYAIIPGTVVGACYFEIFIWIAIVSRNGF